MEEERSFKDIRRQRRRESAKRLRQQFRIYYKSSYGKAGLYILVAFAVIAALTPILAPQPYSYVAPSIDTHVAHLRFETNLTGTSTSVSYNPLMSSSSVSTGSYLLYYSTTDGKVYGTGVGGSADTPVGKVTTLVNQSLSPSNSLLTPTIATFSSFNSFITLEQLSLSNFLLYGTMNGTLSIGQISWSGGAIATGSPTLTNVQNLSENGTLVHTPISNSQPLGFTIPTYVPFYKVTSASALQSTGGSIAQLYTITHNSTGYYLNAYVAVPLSHLWSVKVSTSEVPMEPVFYGSFFTSSLSSLIIEGVGNHLIAYSPSNGNVKWEVNFSSTLTGQVPYIPQKYQFQTNSYNSVFVATSNDNVYGVYTGNHSVYKVLNTSAPINYLSSSPGSAGFPSYFVTETNTSLYMTSQTNTSIFKTAEFALPTTDGNFTYKPAYDINSASFILGSTHGLLVSVKGSLGQYPFSWSSRAESGSGGITQPNIFLDSATGRYEIGVLSLSGHISVYDATAYPINPIPPTLHAPSGNYYLLGTNSIGQDVFSQFIQSFVYDWYLGLAIGIVVMVLAVVVAMVVGYIGGALGSIFETVSLAVYLIPGLALLIAMASVLGAGFGNLIFIVSIISWPFTTFTLIGLVRQIKSRSFVEAAKLSGARPFSILRRHVLPNIAPLLLYLLALSIDIAITGVSTLQFLGIAPLTAPTWGGMLSPMLENFFLAARAPWWVLPPSIALTMFIFAFIFVSRGLDEVTNPRLRRR